jgi:hypothetical protein
LHFSAEDPDALILWGEGFGEIWEGEKKAEGYQAYILLTRREIGINMLERFLESRQLGTE